MRTDGTMKVAVFETDSTSEALAISVGKLFNEAANWLHWETLTEVAVGPKKKDKRIFKTMSLSLAEIFEETDSGTKSTMQLYVHYDDNEYTK
jgi:hypothetical protein